MLPRASMLIIKNWITKSALFSVILAAVATGCMPAGPRALLDGKKLLDQGRFADAVPKLESAVILLRTNAAAATAWNYLGLAYHQAGRATNAAQAYTRALALDQDLTEAHFNRGCLWLDQQRLDLARADFTAYTLRQPNAIEGWLKLATCQLRSHEAIAAEKSFQEVLRLNAHSAEALNGLGLAQLQRNRPRDAVEFFEKALQEQPKYAPALLNLAIVLHRQLGDRPRALQVYREYLGLPVRGPDWDNVNSIAQGLEQELAPPAKPAALAMAKPAPISSPPAAVQLPAREAVMPTTSATIPPAKTAAPPAQSRTNRPSEPARPQPQAPLVTMSDPPVEMVKLAPEQQVKSAQDKRAIEVADARPASKPSTQKVIPAEPAPLPEKRGFLQKINPVNLFRRDRQAPVQKPAATAAETARDATPGVVARYAYRNPGKPAAGDRTAAEKVFADGSKSQQEHRTGEAMERYREAIRLDPSYYEAYYNLGLAATAAGNLPSALAAYESALAIRPDAQDARYNFALVLKQSNYVIDSANELEKILAARPDDVPAHLMLGNISAQQLAQPARAQEHYQKVLSLDPKNPQAANIRYWLTSHRP